MEFLAFASFAVLVVGWIVAPSREIKIETPAVERKAA